MTMKGFHIFVCKGERRSESTLEGDLDRNSLLDYVSEEVQERGLNAEVSCAGYCDGCLGACKGCGVMLVHPVGWWYGGLDQEKVDVILDALAEERVVAEYLVN